MIARNTLLAVIASASLFVSCKDNANQANTQTEEMKVTVEKIPEYNAKDPASVLAAVENAQGGWDDLWTKKDVEYTYDYRYPDGSADVSTERYVFNTEASYGLYSQNDINAMPGTKGKVEQYFDGEKATVMIDGKTLENPTAIEGSDFLRRANYYWFVMPYKLDEGTVLKSLGQEEYNGMMYDKIKVTYEASKTGKAQNDTYILFVNPETKMIDRFFFSLPAMGVNVPVIVANYLYEDIDGQKVATKRTYFMPNEKGEYGETPNIVQTLTNVKFNNGFTSENIMK